MTYSKKQIVKIRENMHEAAKSLPDELGAETPEIFPAWVVGQTYALNDRFQHDGRLWKCNQPEITASADYPPGAPGTESLYAEVAKPGDGTKDNPIRYNNNMALEKDKYYTQYSVLYICFRDTINPVYNDLQYLVEVYVRVVTE